MDKNTPLYGSTSYCHQSASLIVLSRANGFLTQNCLVCGEPRFLPAKDLPKLLCASCKSELNTFTNDQKNYVYRCERCAGEFELASIVPYWDERFEYHGFGLDSDYLYAYTTAPTVIHIKLDDIVKAKKKRAGENRE